MTFSHEKLNDAFALANTRYDLLCSDYQNSEPDSFLTTNFIRTKYKENVLVWLALIRRMFTQNYVDFAGRPLIDDADVVVYLDEDITTPNAWIVQTKTGGVEITTTLGLLLTLDLLCAARWGHVSELFPDQPLPGKSFDSVCSETLAAMLRENLRNGLSNVAKIRLAEFFSNPTAEQRQDWARITTLTMIWVLSHEVGHFLCGHVGYNEAKTGLVGLSERVSANAPGPGEAVLRDVSLAEVQTIWARELMADAYATIRLSLIVSEDVKAGSWAGSLWDVVSSISTASVLPGLAFLLGQQANEKQSASIFRSRYPTEWCRIFGALASVVFVVLPLPNTAVDPRKNPLEQFWQTHLLSKTDWQWFVIRVLEIFETIKSYLNAMDLVPFPRAESENVTEHMCGSLVGARTGLVVLEESPMRVHLLQWMYAMKLLCTEINFNFSHYLARHWLTGKAPREINEDEIRDDLKEVFGPNMKEMVQNLMSANLTNDPAYKILDDWMSNIYSAWEAGEEQVIQRQQECAVLGRHIVQMWQSV